ncbi:hypothetical protein BSL78_08301, partial [Apostichopus japonicus]
MTVLVPCYLEVFAFSCGCVQLAMAPASAGSDFSSQVKTVLLGLTFVAFASSRILLTKLSSNDSNQFDYLPATVVVFSEALKLLVCSTFSINKIYKENNIKQYFQSFSCEDLIILWPWSIPGFLYFVDNLMTFYVVASFETAMVVLFNNFVIISTSILFRIILKHRFSRIQWAVLFILFLSIVSLSKEHFSKCTAKDSVKRSTELASLQADYQEDGICYISPVVETDTTSERDCSNHEVTIEDFYGFFLILAQCFIASSANVYNEKIFKQGDAFEESIYIQNSRLYLFGVIFNCLILMIRTDYRNKVISCGLFHGFNWYAFLLIFDNAALGLTISLVLKYRDNMFHIMCSQLNTVFVISASIIFTNFQPSIHFFLQAPIVLLAIFIYHNAKKESVERVENYQLENISGRRTS